jgi:pimeloyl-ACP methyl ester carboxylesterase
MPHFSAPDGTSLYFTDTGPIDTGRTDNATDTPLLCLAGLTRNGSDFSYLAPHLPDTRLITLDYRGRGQSQWADWQTYTIPTEAQDALALLDYLELEKTAIIGTSRGGLIAMILAATAKHRLAGIALNDVGPELSQVGLDAIQGYLGRNPTAKTREQAAALLHSRMTGFANVPDSRWAEEAAKHYVETASGLTINYDPALAQAFKAASDQPPVDMWPLFDAMADLPLALIRGENSDLLTAETAQKMQDRRPDMIMATVPDRGHIPFLDEPQAVNALHRWITRL